MTRLPSCVSKGTLGKCKRWMRRRANSDCVNLPLPPATLLTPPSATPAATATGAIAVQLNSLLLDMSAMSSVSLCASWAVRPQPREQICVSLRHQDVVSLKRNVPQGHHGVIFMDYVVTVDGVFAQPVAEAEEQLHALVGMQLGNIFAPQVRRYCRSHPVAAQDPVLLQVNMDGVGPIARKVSQQPLLNAVLLHGEAEHLCGLATRSAIPVPAIEELAVDGPLAVQAVKLERAHDSGMDVRV